MNIKISPCLVIVAWVLSLQNACATVIYSTGFESGLDPVWSTGSTLASESTLGSYNGNYSLAHGTTLTLTSLPLHATLALRFDLYLFGSWDGENTVWGKDHFSLSGDVAGSWTFTNHQPEGQSYPGTPDEIHGSGSAATHVYRGLDPTGLGDQFLIDHAGDSFTVTFGGPTTQADEWWGIDNVTVTVDTVPLPGTALLLASGLSGLMAGVRRRGNRSGHDKRR